MILRKARKWRDLTVTMFTSCGVSYAYEMSGHPYCPQTDMFSDGDDRFLPCGLVTPIIVSTGVKEREGGREREVWKCMSLKHVSAGWILQDLINVTGFAVFNSKNALLRKLSIHLWYKNI